MFPISLSLAWDACADKYATSATTVTGPHSAWLLDWLLRRASNEGQKGLVLADIACGGGAMALAAAARPEIIQSVIASDFSPAMCANVERAAKALAEPHAPVQVMVSDAGQLSSIPSESVDIATCMFGIMLLPDPIAAAKELVRITKPGGMIASATWMPQESQFHGVLFNLMKHISHEVAAEKQQAAGNTETAPTPAPTTAPSSVASSLPALPYSRVEHLSDLFASLGLESLLVTSHPEVCAPSSCMADWWRSVQGSAPMFNQQAGGERGVQLAVEWANSVWGADAPFSLTATSLIGVARKPL